MLINENRNLKQLKTHFNQWANSFKNTLLSKNKEILTKFTSLIFQFLQNLLLNVTEKTTKLSHNCPPFHFISNDNNLDDQGPIVNYDFSPTDHSGTFSITASCKQNQVSNFESVCIKPDYIEGCSVYQTSSTCHKCSNGYALSKIKKCDFQPLYTGVINHILGCIKQTSGVICQFCASGFYKKQNTCHLGVKDCAEYNTEGICTECHHQYSLILSQCRHNSLLGCKYETESHTCNECYAPFRLQGQHCNIEECRILNDYGCVACQCGYYLTAERKCEAIAPGCLRYERGICKDCLPHYKLKGGVCEIQGCTQYDGNYCKVCSDKYELTEGECRFKNCLDWMNDACLACKAGFGVKNGICVDTVVVNCV